VVFQQQVIAHVGHTKKNPSENTEGFLILKLINSRDSTDLQADFERNYNRTLKIKF